jgi:hypothetical protein
MRSASRAFAVAFAIGLSVLLAVGAVVQRSEAFTLGVAAASPVTVVRGAELCQRSIEVPAPFSRVRLEVDSERGPAPSFDVLVLSSGRQVAGNPVAGALSGRRALVVTVGDVPEGSRISVCVRNTGPRPLHVYGNSGVAHPSSVADLDGEPIDYDMDLTFLRGSDASLLTLIGDMVERASLFRGEWIGTWSVWVVVLLLLTAFPFLLGMAMRSVWRAAEDQRSAASTTRQ